MIRIRLDRGEKPGGVVGGEARLGIDLDQPAGLANGGGLRPFEEIQPGEFGFEKAIRKCDGEAGGRIEMMRGDHIRQRDQSGF